MIYMSNSHNHNKITDQLNLDKKLSEQETHPDYLQHSLWSNLWYGLIMLAIIILPPLIPGASTQVLVASYIGIVVAVYTAVLIVKIFTVLRDKGAPKKRSSRRHNNT